MTKTFNRMPQGVNEPDIDYQFFNHNNWKRLNSNKNFLSIDQETFEDSNNIYVDGDGVLRSRPAIKLDTSNMALPNEVIQKMWSFSKTTVYLVGEFEY